MPTDLRDVLRHFDIEIETSPYGNGHINDTYTANSEPKYILQRINSAIFKKPEEVMSNIVEVTEFLRKKIIAAGGDPDRETLTWACAILISIELAILAASIPEIILLSFIFSSSFFILSKKLLLHNL